MKYFITYVIAIQPDGSVKEFEGGIPVDKQEEMLRFFNSRSDEYTDKSEIIARVYRKIRLSILKEYEAQRKAGEEIYFKAFLIVKLYEHTTRLDRGDGISMIRLSRDIMNYDTQT